MKPHYKLSSKPIKAGDRVLVMRSPVKDEIGQVFWVRKVMGCRIFTLPLDYTYRREMVLRIKKIAARRAYS